MTTWKRLMEKTVVVSLRCTAMVKVPVLNPTNLHWKHWRFCNNMEKVACHVMSDCFYLRNIRACRVAITLCHVPSNHSIMSHPYHQNSWLEVQKGHIPKRRVEVPCRTWPKGSCQEWQSQGGSRKNLGSWLLVVAEKKSMTNLPWSEERIMHWNWILMDFFFCIYGWFSYSRELSQWRILFKKIYEISLVFVEGQIVALKSMDKIEPLQTQKAYWCWGSYLWNLSCDFNILQAHFRLNASFNDSIRLIRPILAAQPLVARVEVLVTPWIWGVISMSYKKDWYVMYWIYLSTVPFNVVAAAVFGAGGVLSVVVIAVVIVAGLLVGVRLVQFFHTNKSKCVPSTSTNPCESQGSPFHPFTE